VDTPQSRGKGDRRRVAPVSTLAVPCDRGHSFEQALGCYHITWDETQKPCKTRTCLLVVTLLAAIGLVFSASQNHQPKQTGRKSTAAVSRFPHGRAFQPYPDDKRPLSLDGSWLDNPSEPRPSPRNFPKKATVPAQSPRIPEGTLVEPRRNRQGHPFLYKEPVRQPRKPKPSPRNLTPKGIITDLAFRSSGGPHLTRLQRPATLPNVLAQPEEHSKLRAPCCLGTLRSKHRHMSSRAVCPLATTGPSSARHGLTAAAS